ncbi:molybdenum cofactor guanylyltransferase [Niallia taxi]|uniref:molybdenum cofactor guanylyltransferase n=1 Tax=Niallia taxi TaxID=2499688 RepID=UPI001642ED74|nr:molybdenum cofactor guanylyltransferase [Niallia taxi]MDE5052550.1 molybdenum cofactor guanylyltransferase [Niallia taxi]MED3962917.1 molybdenum cofactor guanylyltransferase [Niallia taxi]WOD65597.1 molybdenum cofactor guanylyltransferase [Niallia taxi]
MPLNHIYTGIILAGGQSRRFGSQKAFASREGKYFYQYSIDALHPFTSSNYLVAHPEIKSSFQSLKDIIVIEDADVFKGYGPLAGIYSVMAIQNAEWFVVLPIDSPFITTKTIEKLLSHIQDGYDAVVPVINKKQQPLIAVYNKRIQKKIYQALSQKELSMQRFLQQINVKFVEDFDKQHFININFQEDYTTFI